MEDVTDRNLEQLIGASGTQKEWGGTPALPLVDGAPQLVLDRQQLGVLLDEGEPLGTTRK